MRAIPVLALTAAALVGSALPAVADTAQLDEAAVAALAVESTATLEARGAAVSVPTTVVCAKGASGSLFVQVTQNVRGDIATGDRYVPIPECTGTFQQVYVTVVSRTKAFRPGTAYTTASLSVWTQNDWGSAEQERDITIVR
ncbi:hypothetical protein [Saccharothrix variisporea]|uniref:Secreted protein n=1 Tax=Saccharothrix variisporea TaxID=543527 RepID=A0A495X2E3_9PSEU|nr:hypothetical protein [Saccharothrix variisporea]RKT67709.1 hypothetical protein DFJ66_0885 [Saccharothrix variisporea]